MIYWLDLISRRDNSEFALKSNCLLSAFSHNSTIDAFNVFSIFFAVCKRKSRSDMSKVFKNGDNCTGESVFSPLNVLHPNEISNAVNQAFGKDRN